MQKICLPPKAAVHQMLVLMNLSQSRNLQRLEKKFKSAKDLVKMRNSVICIKCL